MVKTIILYQDMSFQEKTIKIGENKLKISKDYTPSFKLGTSVFKEKSFHILKRILMFWRKPRNLTILVQGCPEAMSLEEESYIDTTGVVQNRPAFNFNFGTMDDSIKFLKKVTLKSIADKKQMSNNQFLIMALMLGAILMFQFMIMKGVTI